MKINNSEKKLKTLETIPLLGIWNSFRKRFEYPGNEDLILVDSDGVNLASSLDIFQKHGELCTLYIHDMSGKNYSKGQFNTFLKENHKFANYACICIRDNNGRIIFNSIPKENLYS